MKRLSKIAILAAVLAFVGAFAAGAADEVKKDQTTMKMEPKVMTLKGEIVDMGCYMGHGAKGPDHASCALRCIANGMPMGLLTADGTLYVMTMNHDNADPYNSAKKMAADIVEITGPVSERSGVKSIEVTDVKGTKAPEKNG
jgi:hypothetical protein